MKKYLRFNYESEIRLSLLLLILFFVLINYGVSYLLNLSKSEWKEESLQNLRGIAYSASQLYQNTAEKKELNHEFRNLILLWGINSLEVIDSNGYIIASSVDRIEKGRDSLSFSLLSRFRDQLSKGKSFFSNIYPGLEGGNYQSYFYSFLDKITENIYFARAEKEVTRLSRIEQITKYESWVIGLGIIGVLFLSFLLFKNIFSPYQKMKRKAEEENILPPSAQKEDAEVVVEVFQKVIAELKEKESKLQELYIQTNNKAKDLERYNQYILKSINNGVIICDNQGRITGFNQAAQRLLGPSFKLSLNLHYKEALGKNTSISSLLEDIVVKKNLIREVEINIKADREGDRFLMANSALLRDENENIIGLVLVLTDLTELKKIQQEIAFKQKMATLGEISAGLAHELRNSMGALLGYSKMLKKGFKEGNAAYPVVESIITESLTIENLLQRFLDFAKPLELKLEKFDLSEVVQDCIKIAREKRPDMRISLEAEEKISPLPGDPFLLRQAFQNLIQNSIDALKAEGEIKIILQVLKDNGKPWLKITLEDNGCGIPQENLGKIFNPFFTSKEKGIGLGLSLVKKIVDLHKGKIEVESELGKGTNFTLLFPLTEPPLKPEENNDLKPEPEKIPA
jgi:PAS domain S-box-containing protein